MKDVLNRALEAVDQVLLGKHHAVKLAVACILARGHLLIEDLPGMGKTTLSQALARVMGMSYQRNPVHQRPFARRYSGHLSV